MQNLKAIMQKHWGYDSFRPLQAEAMQSVLSGHDSLVVLPTGGGKSLCYQIPAMAMPGMALIVSPLISLMKDQVDALGECGVPAASLNSNMTPGEKSNVNLAIRQNRLKMLYISPERLLSNGFLEYMQNLPISFIAVDEVHCVSMWGHDFRPEYRGLRALKETFPNIGVHGYTATATTLVRDDIVEQLNFKSPEILIGSFDRPNLNYRVERRQTGKGMLDQMRETIDKHKGDSGIIYAISRKKVESIAEKLCQAGYRAKAYHAGFDADRRRDVQESFIREEVDIIVATVAFGMGIDKSNVRYVIHAAMPKSLEHYQQESGRAGRDGLDADCCLFYSMQDYVQWKNMLSENEGEGTRIALDKLDEMQCFCQSLTCRHQHILNYFGQCAERENCGACDICLDGIDSMDDALITAQKILSCVIRLKQSFGLAYVADVLHGSRNKRILENCHDSLTTYGLLKDPSSATVRDWIGQLLGQDCLQQVGEFNVLKVTEKGWQVLHGEITPVLLKASEKKESEKPKRKTRYEKESWRGVDHDMFEMLRGLRRDIAAEKNLPAYIIFDDNALRDMARLRPSTPAGFCEVHGVGQKKLNQYGEAFLEAIRNHCRANGLLMNVRSDAENNTESIANASIVGFHSNHGDS